ncbi:MAG TPA: DUF896 domain-containing protein, partial [Haloplasmataceae bacterium]
MNPNLIKRINELANKAKREGLTSAEKEEQKKLREEYLHQFRAQFRKELLNVRVIDAEGNDVTPKKLKEAQQRERINST